VELVIHATDAYNAGDMDATMSFYTPDLEALPDASVFPDAGPVHGRREFMSWLQDIDTAWVEAKWVASEVFALDDGRVVYRGDWGGEGLASGIEIASSITGVFTIRDGQISRVEYFFDHGKALKAVGLEE
jgi:ketosteroid isomerase-like protein